MGPFHVPDGIKHALIVIPNRYVTSPRRQRVSHSLASRSSPHLVVRTQSVWRARFKKTIHRAKLAFS